jgi:GT2 family glycosyltransferase
MSKVYIIILNWNGWQDTIECLESIYKLSYCNYKVIVCDNNSDDHSLEFIKQWAEGSLIEVNFNKSLFQESNYLPVIKPISFKELNAKNRAAKEVYTTHEERLILIQTGGNLGYAGGNNIGMRYALSDNDCEYIWILNNDTVVESNSLCSMIEYTKEFPDISAVGAKVSYYNNPNLIQCRGGGTIYPWFGLTSLYSSNELDNLQIEKAIELEHIYGVSILVKRSVLEKVRLIDERYFMYLEETDWSLKMRRLGFKLSYCPRAMIYHKDGGSAGKKSAFQDYYYTRNSLIFFKRNYPSFFFVALIFIVVRTLAPKVARLQVGRILILFRAYWDFLLGKEGFQKI